MKQKNNKEKWQAKHSSKKRNWLTKHENKTYREATHKNKHSKINYRWHGNQIMKKGNMTSRIKKTDIKIQLKIHEILKLADAISSR